jgi:hypothetical protein
VSLGDALSRGEVALRSSLRLGAWLVRGVDGFFEVRLDVDDVVLLTAIDPTQAERVIAEAEARADAPTQLLVLTDGQRADVARKTSAAADREVLAGWTVTVRWGSTSAHQASRSFGTPEEAEALRTLRASLPVHAVAFTPRPDVARPPDRAARLLEDVRARRVTASITMNGANGLLVAAPAPFAGHPLGLATFEGERLVRLVLPFGATLLDRVRAAVTEGALEIVSLSPAQVAELERKCRPEGLEAVLREERVTLTGRAVETFEGPERAPALAKAIGDAFMATLTFER